MGKGNQNSRQAILGRLKIVRKTIIALLIISILVSCYVYADNDTSITIEFKLKNGEIRQQVIQKNEGTEEKDLLKGVLRGLKWTSI